MTSLDVVLVGGGLANALIAYRLRQRHPSRQLAMVEQGPTLGGQHTWSFHDADLAPAQRAWMAPLVECTWPAYEVRFPRRRRRLAAAYHAITADRLHRVVSAELGPAVHFGCAVRHVGPQAVTLADGRVLTARCVLDGRGFVDGWLVAGYQLFLGQHVTLAEEHGLDVPVLMDATVAQHEGYRFVYLLPWSPRHLLIEDTYYADEPRLDPALVRRRIADYAAARGWRIVTVDREEQGVLPIPLGGDLTRLWASHAAGVPAVGMRAGLFHHTTGYSLPDAVALADALAALPALTSDAVSALVRARATVSWQRQAFFRLLNRMLFRAAEPARRYRVLERFYGLPEQSIARFYAGRPTLLDRARVLTGRPPVPLWRAVRCLRAPAPGGAG